MAFGKSGGKDGRALWSVRLNGMRKIVMHPAKQQFLNAELGLYDWRIQERGAEYSREDE